MMPSQQTRTRVNSATGWIHRTLLSRGEMILRGYCIDDDGLRRSDQRRTVLAGQW